MKIAIVNQKGGSGKSTTAVLLAKAFADSGKTVCLIDCDPQGGASTLFQAKRKPGLFDLLTHGCTAREAIHESEVFKNVQIIPADFRLDQIFTTADPFVFEVVTEEIKADTIVFDTPPTLQGLTRSAIIEADRVLIPCEMSETAFEPTRYTTEQVRKNKKDPEVLISGYKKPGDCKGTTKELSEQYTEAFKDCFAGTLPRSLTAAKLATPKGKWTAKTRETIEQPLLNLYGGTK